MSIVPVEWTRMMGNLRVAQVARAAMKAPATGAVARDEATDRYVRAVDSIIDDLDVLSERLDLGRITMFLSKRERS